MDLRYLHVYVRLLHKNFWKLSLRCMFLALLTFCMWQGGTDLHRTDTVQPLEKSKITVVTAYYDIPSKRPRRTYLSWIKNFIGNVPCHLYVFTSKSNIKLLQGFRQAHLNRTRFILRELEDLRMNKLMDVWSKTKFKDPESGHSPFLYLIWNEKWSFVSDAIEDNPFESDYFIWCDIGAFRSRRFIASYKRFPDVSRTESILHDHDKLTLLLLNPLDERELHYNLSSHSFFERGHNHIGGGFAAGHRDAWNKWTKYYYEMQAQFILRGQNAGKDQNVMNAVAVSYPDSVNLLRPTAYFNGAGDPWFYLQYYFS